MTKLNKWDALIAFLMTLQKDRFIAYAYVWAYIPKKVPLEPEKACVLGWFPAIYPDAWEWYLHCIRLKNTKHSRVAEMVAEWLEIPSEHSFIFYGDTKLQNALGLPICPTISPLVTYRNMITAYYKKYIINQPTPTDENIY